MQYLYNAGDDYHFMDQTNYEQIHLAHDVLGENTDLLKEGMVITVQFHDGHVIRARCPITSSSARDRDRSRIPRRYGEQRPKAGEARDRRRDAPCRSSSIPATRSASTRATASTSPASSPFHEDANGATTPLCAHESGA